MNEEFEELYPKTHVALQTPEGIAEVIRLMLQELANNNIPVRNYVEQQLPNPVAPTVYPNPDQNTGVNY